MTLKSPSPLSNFITDAVKANGQQYISVISDGQPSHAQICLSGGPNLGVVQSIKWSLNVGDIGAKCVIETLASPAELKALMQDTTMLVKPWGSPVHWLWVYYVAKLRGFCRNSRYLSLFR